MSLEGSLRDMSLVDLIRFLRARAKSGVLLLTSGAERGTIYFSEGRLIDAALARGAERRLVATAEGALMRLLQWDEAAFAFQPDPAVARRAARIARDGEWLIEESRLRCASPPRPITLDTRVQLAALPASAESGISLEIDEWRILSQVAASPDVRAICDLAGMSPARAIAVLTDLVAIGLVSIVPAPDRAAPAGPPSYDLLAALLQRMRGPRGAE